MLRTVLTIALAILFLPSFCQARPFADFDPPSFSNDPDLTAGFRLLYEQKFPEGRAKFIAWQAQHADNPFAEVAVGASYLFEEFYAQGVLTSEFFLDDEKFLGGIKGKPDAERMKQFLEALGRARVLAKERLKNTPKEPESLFSLTIAAGMESDADSILLKKPFDALKRLKEANESAKLLLVVRPDAKDAYVALGSSNYIIGSLNPGFRMLLWFDNVHGDKTLGMQQVQITADNGRYLRPFSRILLALAARREKQNALAQKLLLQLTEEFPASPLFAAEYSKLQAQWIPAKKNP